MDLRRPGSGNVVQDKDKFDGWRVTVKYVNNKVVVLGLIPCSLVERYQFSHRIYLQVHGRITVYKSTSLYGFTSQKTILLIFTHVAAIYLINELQ